MTHKKLFYGGWAVVLAAVALAALGGYWLVQGPKIIDRDLRGLDGDVNRGAYVARLSGCIACHTDNTDKTAARDDIADDIDDIGHALELIHAVHQDSEGAYHPMYASLTAAEFDAFWNFMCALEDKSNGSHNPTYTKAMLAQAKTALGI